MKEIPRRRHCNINKYNWSKYMIVNKSKWPPCDKNGFVYKMNYLFIVLPPKGNPFERHGVSLVPTIP